MAQLNHVPKTEETGHKDYCHSQNSSARPGAVIIFGSCHVNSERWLFSTRVSQADPLAVGTAGISTDRAASLGCLGIFEGQFDCSLVWPRSTLGSWTRPTS